MVERAGSRKVEVPRARTTAPPAEAPATTVVPSTTKAKADDGARYAQDGTSSKGDADAVRAKSALPRTGVLSFLMTQKASYDVEDTAARAQTPSMRALLAVRDQCPPQYSPHVAVTLADGRVVTGSLRGIDKEGRASIGDEKLPLDAKLARVVHFMDTVGDLHSAGVTVFDADKHVDDPYELGGYAGKKLTIETYDAEHPTLAVAARKGDVSGSTHVLKGATADRLSFADGGGFARGDWNIAKVVVEQPAYRWKDDAAQRLSAIGDALLPGTPVVVTRDGLPPLTGTLLGTAKDSMGDDYVVVQEKNGVRTALRSIVDLKADARSIEIWRHPEYAAVYGS